MRSITCECGNTFRYITVNKTIECSKCNKMLDVIPSIFEELKEEMSEEDGTSI